MSDPGWHLAEFNIARMKYPLDYVEMAGFVDQLEPVNALADSAPGFVWRHQTDEGDSTSIRMFDDPQIIINYSLWESIEQLRDFTFNLQDHKELLRKRREWFTPVPKMPVIVMWWVPAGEIPTLEDARERLEHLRDNGPTAYAFNFRKRFAPGDE